MKTLVLLSGGLDSTAALLWALHQGRSPAACFIYYGQPAATRECQSAIAATRELGVPFHRLDVASVFYGGASRGLFVPQAAGIENGLDRAFVPLRNPVLLSAAAARALMLWPGERVELVAGFNADDQLGFPDCRTPFVSALQGALNLALGPDEAVSIATPFVDFPKRSIVEWVKGYAPERMPLIEASWSCYRERGPCRECTACVTRARALAEEAET
jgi:7-cyano-7-deazaguanine synthase